MNCRCGQGTPTASPGVAAHLWCMDNRLWPVQSTLWYWWPQHWQSVLPHPVAARYPARLVCGAYAGKVTAGQTCVTDAQGTRQPSRWRSPSGALVGPGQPVSPGDTLEVVFPAGPREGAVVATLYLLINPEGPPVSPLTENARPVDWVEWTTADTDRGLLDCSGPFRVDQPASLAQLQAIHSARWGLWYEFARWERDPQVSLQGFTAAPVNPLWLAAQPGSRSTGFNLDDVPRFPLLTAEAMRLYPVSWGRAAIRTGVSSLLSYLRPDGSMPYLLAPWSGAHVEEEAPFHTYHSLRMLGEALLWDWDDRLTGAMLQVFDRLFDHAMRHTVRGLFHGRASASGALLDALWRRHRRGDARAQWRQAMRPLADALCTAEARAQTDDFAEYLPWAPIGLIRAAQVFGGVAYTREAQYWLDRSWMALQRDRRFYLPEPRFTPSNPSGAPGANPLSVWYHTDAMMLYAELTGDIRWERRAEWVWNDYYDSARYADHPAWRIVDTGDADTERWGSASAEDALRMLAKWMWQRRRPGLYQRIRVSRRAPS